MQVGSFFTDVRDFARTVVATPLENIADIARAGNLEVQGLAPLVDAIAPDSMATGDSGQSLFVQFRDTVQSPVYAATEFDPLAAEVVRSWEAGRFNPYLGIVVSVVIGFIAGPIGAAIVGEAFAAAYPLVTAAIGQVAVQTAINGGDVETAVKNAVPGLVAGYVGVNITSATQSAVIGRAAGTAVVAAARGKSVEDAVKTSLIMSGLNTGSSQIFNSVLAQSTPSPGGNMLNDYEFGIDANTVFIDTSPEPVLFPDFASDPTATVPTVDYAFGGDMHAGFSPLPDPTLSFHDPVYDPPPVGWPAPSEPNVSIWDSITQAAMAAIRVREAYQQSQRPAAPARPGGGAITPTATGMLITRNPLTGAIQTSRPAVGVRYGLPDGRTMVNNGDGTFSLISGFGAETRIPYSAAAAAGTNWVLYGALGLGALLLLRK